MSKKIVNINDKMIEDIRHLITESKTKVAVTVNSELTILYWNIGKRINQEILQNQRAEYEKQIM